MIKKLFQGMFVSGGLVLLPVLGNTDMLWAPQLWILIVIGVFASVFQPDYNPFKKAPHSVDRGTATQIIWSVYITQLIILLEAAYYRYPQSMTWDLWTTIGLLLMIGGLVMRTWAVWTLRQFFTWYISVQDKQPVVTTGPYAFVRHPGYVGAFMTYTSTAMFLHSWLGLVISVIMLAYAFLRRIRYEEELLHLKLGEDYQNYCKTVGCFLPKLG